MMSVANVRETPYLTSSQVMGEPSSNVTPSLSVKVQVFVAVGACRCRSRGPA